MRRLQSIRYGILVKLSVMLGYVEADRSFVWFANERSSECHPAKIWHEIKKQNNQSIVPIEEFTLSNPSLTNRDLFMATEVNRNRIKPPTRYTDVQPNSYRAKCESSKLRLPGFGSKTANKSETSGLYDNREENGNVQLRQPQRTFGYNKTVSVSKSPDVRSSLPVPSSKLPTIKGSQGVLPGTGVSKTSSVPALGKSKKEFERNEYSRGSYRKFEESHYSDMMISKEPAITVQQPPESPKKKSLLSRLSFKSSSFRIKSGIFKNEQQASAVPIPATKKASTLPQGSRTPEIITRKARSPVRKFTAKRFSFVDSKSKCSDSRSSSFEIISDLSPDAMNAALKRPPVRPQNSLESNTQKHCYKPDINCSEITGPFLAMIISDGQCRLEQLATQNKPMEDVIYENETDYIRESVSSSCGTQQELQVETPSAKSDSVEIRPYIETDIDFHSLETADVFATVNDYERALEAVEVLSSEIDCAHETPPLEEWKSSKAYEPSQGSSGVERQSESESSVSHSSRERDFLIDDEIIDQPCLLFVQNKGHVSSATKHKDHKPDGDVPRQCLEEINTADENDTLSACDSIKSESSLEAWLKQIECEKRGDGFSSFEDENLDCKDTTLTEGDIKEMLCEMAPSADSREGVIGSSKADSIPSSDACVADDLTSIKMLLLRLRTVLMQADTVNPFDSSGRNGFYRQLALSDSRQNLCSLDSVASSSDVINRLSEEIVDLKRERILLKQQLEEKDRIIKQMKDKVPRRNDVLGDAKWQLPPTGKKVKSDKKSEKINVATQTERIKSSFGSRTQNSAIDGICARTRIHEFR
ncbi:uncharacterized protein LOC136031809 isoform X3 [Artemia franciscana]